LQTLRSSVGTRLTSFANGLAELVLVRTLGAELTLRQTSVITKLPDVTLVAFYEALSVGKLTQFTVAAF